MGLYQNIAESTAGNGLVNLFDGSGNAISSTAGAVNVNISSGSISVGVVDQTAFTYGTSTALTTAGVYNSTIVNLTSGQSGAISLTPARGTHVSLRSPTGVEYIGQAAMAASIPVTIASNQSALSISNAALGSVAAGAAGTQSSLGGVVFNTTLPTLTNGQQAAVQSDSSGRQITNDTNTASLNAKVSPSSAAITAVAYSATTIALLASNAARKAVILTNLMGKSAYISFAATATAATATFLLQANGTYESNLGTYTGAISALASGVTSGNIIVTELT